MKSMSCDETTSRCVSRSSAAAHEEEAPLPAPPLQAQPRHRHRRRHRIRHSLIVMASPPPSSPPSSWRRRHGVITASSPPSSPPSSRPWARAAEPGVGPGALTRPSPARHRPLYFTCYAFPPTAVSPGPSVSCLGCSSRFLIVPAPVP